MANDRIDLEEPPVAGARRPIRPPNFQLPIRRLSGHFQRDARQQVISTVAMPRILRLTMPNSDTASSRTSRFIRAPIERIYHALTDPRALEVWQAPGDMTGQVHAFDLRPGGGYRMSLYYPADDAWNPGKTTDREDRFTVRFVELTRPSRIVQVVEFDSADPAFQGEMRMTITLAEVPGGTEVVMAFENIPSGIRPEDNDAGTRSSLEKLARYVEEPEG